MRVRNVFWGIFGTRQRVNFAGTKGVRMLSFVHHCWIFIILLDLSSQQDNLDTDEPGKSFRSACGTGHLGMN